MPGLNDMLGHRRSIRECAVIYRIPRNRGLQTMWGWPLLRWRHMPPQKVTFVDTITNVDTDD